MHHHWYILCESIFLKKNLHSLFLTFQQVRNREMVHNFKICIVSY